MDRPPRIFVSGAAGFLGRQLCQALQRKAFWVTAMDLNASSGPWDRFISGDITRGIDYNMLFDHQTVFHLAGKVHALSEIAQDEAEYFQINTEGTRQMLEAARAARVSRFVFFSTVKAMSREGTPQMIDRDGASRPWTEADSLEPDTPYGRSKREAEKLVLGCGYVPEPVVLRLCMVYGAGAKGNMQRMLQAVSRNRFPPLPEVGNRRSMVHVQDVIQAALLAAEKPQAVGQIFIVSDARAYSTRQIYEWMCQALEQSSPRWTVPLWLLRSLSRAGDLIGRRRGRRWLFDSDTLNKLVGSAWFSSQKIESLLGFRPMWTLEKGMPEMVNEMQRRRMDAVG